MQWDVFICHASEDKEAIARLLAEALIQAGLRVWFDEHILMLGDGLRRSIDQGLKASRYGIVILSPHFFAKEWPQRELDGLVTRELQEGVFFISPRLCSARHSRGVGQKYPILYYAEKNNRRQ